MMNTISAIIPTAAERVPGASPALFGSMLARVTGSSSLPATVSPKPPVRRLSSMGSGRRSQQCTQPLNLHVASASLARVVEPIHDGHVGGPRRTTARTAAGREGGGSGGVCTVHVHDGDRARLARSRVRARPGAPRDETALVCHDDTRSSTAGIGRERGGRGSSASGGCSEHGMGGIGR